MIDHQLTKLVYLFLHLT